MPQAATTVPDVDGFSKGTIHPHKCAEGKRNLGFVTKDPAGIDDFLVHYKLQPRSIFDFMSTLEEPETHCLFVNPNFGPEIMPPYVYLPSNMSLSPFITSSTGKGKARAAMQDADERKSKKARAFTCRKRVNLTLAQREERRRGQNREAQRRYREKRMLQLCQPMPFLY